MGKINFGNLLSAGVAIAGLVQRAQDAGGSGKDKHEIVANSVKELWPIIEGAAGKNLADDAEVNAAVDACIVAEKAVLTARENLDRVIASVRVARAQRSTAGSTAG